MYYSSEHFKLACNQTTEGVRLGLDWGENDKQTP